MLFTSALVMPCLFMTCQRRVTRTVTLLLTSVVVTVNGGSLGEPPPRAAKNTSSIVMTLSEEVW